MKNCIGVVKAVTPYGELVLETDHEKDYNRIMFIGRRDNLIRENPVFKEGEKLNLEYRSNSSGGFWYIISRVSGNGQPE